ncbi:MAG: peptidoglycan DD-metalloendopeptidase family protein [Thermoleophilia bacterium]|nr:peptidoglycan DD-metalloendopeptidase family protein [Thermoleophilia bacterium]
MPAQADMLSDQLNITRAKQAVDEQQIAAINKKTNALQAAVDRMTSQIREFDAPIARLNFEIGDLDARTRHRTERIAALQVEFVSSKSEIRRLNRETVVARERLANRLVSIYKGNDQGIAGWLTGSESIGDVLGRQEAANQIAFSETSIVQGIEAMQVRVRLKRAHNHDLQRNLRDEITGLNADVVKLASDRADIAGRQASVEQLRSGRAHVIQSLTDRQADLEKEVDTLDSDAKALKEAITSGATTFSGSVPIGASPTGLGWPVSGPIVSPFGWRWGRMHEGVDIAATTGTPIHASAAGVVTYAGWMSGYGNFVIIQHAGSLSTAYGHQSQIASRVGQVVMQGQIIGFIGCTGHCFGPHVHFETRINGNAVDPMAYL